MRIPKLKEAGAARSDEVGRCGGIAHGGDCRQLSLSRHYAAAACAGRSNSDCCSGWCRAVNDKGKATVAFAREARTEVRKVIWPTRRKTLHTTLIVAAVTAVMSLILWGLDGILVRPVSFITGLRF